jgi:hypothetical protein
MKRIACVIVLALVAVSCQDVPGPEGALSRPQFEIWDGAHDGNEHFYFLPRLAPQPDFSGVFDGTQNPVVEVCSEWNDVGCVVSIASFTTEDGTVVAAGESYTANWRPVLSGAVVGQTYRIYVLLEGTVLGFADVVILDNGKDIKSLQTGETFPLIDMSTLAIRFRIEEGAVEPPAPATDGFATGTGGRNWRYDGTQWTGQATICSCNLFGVWGTSMSDVFAVGSAGAIRHYNGSTWSTQTSAQSMNNRAVWGSASNDVFIVGEGGTRIEHYNGSSWSEMTSGLTSGALYGVSGTSSSNVYSVGYDATAGTGIVLHYIGGGWEWITPTGVSPLRGVWAASPSDVFVVGSAGTIRRYNGSSWTTMTSNTSENLLDVWAAAPDDVFAIGENGTILHYNGNVENTWSAMSSGVTNHLQGIWGTSSSDVLVVGGPTVTTFLRYNGTSWVRQEPSSGNLAILDVWVP